MGREERQGPRGGSSGLPLYAEPVTRLRRGESDTRAPILVGTEASGKEHQTPGSDLSDPKKEIPQDRIKRG